MNKKTKQKQNKNKNKNKNKTKNPLFPKFQLIPILRFWVMHDYVCFIAPIDYWPVSHSARHQRPARERHKIRVASRAIQILHISTFQLTFKCEYNDFISKYTDINNLHVTQIDLLHNDTFCST